MATEPAAPHSSTSVVAHGAAAVGALWLLIVGIAAFVKLFSKGVPRAEVATWFTVIGGLGLVLVLLSWRGSRAAWAYLTTMLATVAVFTLFGSGALRKAWDISFGLALLVPGFFAVVTVLIGSSSPTYRRRST